MTDRYTRTDSDFLSAGERCAAWLFRPVDAPGPRPPMVVMAHGFAGLRSVRLPAYAARFAQQGMAVLLFDYRHFGDSDGQPRQLVDHRRQHCDWLAAVAHASTIDGVDPQRIALWGSSFSGGHALAVAAEIAEIRAIVLQTPMLNVLRSLKMPIRFAPQALWHGLRDYATAVVGRTPHYVPIVAPPHQFAALNQPGCDEGFRLMMPPGIAWENRVTARSLLSSVSFRPSTKAAHVNCPAMLIIAEQDQVVRPKVIEQVAARLPQAELIRVQADHYQIYLGELFDHLSELQAEFLARCLR